MSEKVSQRNLEHVIEHKCVDPDCEIHNPDVIEDSVERWTHKAYFLAGAHSMVDALEADPGDHEDPIVAALAHVIFTHHLNTNWP